MSINNARAVVYEMPITEEEIVFLLTRKPVPKAEKEKAISTMFAAARTMPKGDWRAYSDCKGMIANLPLTCVEYDRIIAALVDILEV